MIKLLFLAITLLLANNSVSANTFACPSGDFAEQREMAASDVAWSSGSGPNLATGSIEYSVLASSHIEGRPFESLYAIGLQEGNTVFSFPIAVSESNGKVTANFVIAEPLRSSFELRFGYINHNERCAKLYVYRAIPAHNK